jgi:hypothetical protein
VRPPSQLADVTDISSQQRASEVQPSGLLHPSGLHRFAIVSGRNHSALSPGSVWPSFRIRLRLAMSKKPARRCLQVQVHFRRLI